MMSQLSLGVILVAKLSYKHLHTPAAANSVLSIQQSTNLHNDKAVAWELAMKHYTALQEHHDMELLWLLNLHAYVHSDT